MRQPKIYTSEVNLTMTEEKERITPSIKIGDRIVKDHIMRRWWNMSENIYLPKSFNIESIKIQNNE